MLKKIAITSILTLAFISMFAQFRVRQPRELQHHYLFSTNNPLGSGHLEWGFHDSVVYRDWVDGPSTLNGGHVEISDSFPTQKPVTISDSNGIVKYAWETVIGTMIITYSDSAGDIIYLTHQGYGKEPEQMKIYDVFHLW